MRQNQWWGTGGADSKGVAAKRPKRARRLNALNKLNALSQSGCAGLTEEFLYSFCSKWWGKTSGGRREGADSKGVAAKRPKRARRLNALNKLNALSQSGCAGLTEEFLYSFCSKWWGKTSGGGREGRTPRAWQQNARNGRGGLMLWINWMPRVKVVVLVSQRSSCTLSAANDEAKPVVGGREGRTPRAWQQDARNGRGGLMLWINWMPWVKVVVLGLTKEFLYSFCSKWWGKTSGGGREGRTPRAWQQNARNGRGGLMLWINWMPWVKVVVLVSQRSSCTLSAANDEAKPVVGDGRGGLQGRGSKTPETGAAA